MIWIILIIMLVILLAGIFYEGFLMLIYPIYDFFFHTRWGLLAIVTFTLSYIFGFLSKKTREDVKLKDEFIDSFKTLFITLSNKPISKTTNLIPMEKQNKLQKTEGTVVDMTTITLDGALKSFAIELNKPEPQIFLTWGNNRTRKRVERVSILNDYVLAIKQLGQNYMDLQASALLSHETVDKLMKSKSKDLDIELLKKEVEENLLIETKERQKQETKTAELRNKKIEAEIDDLKTDTRIKQMNAESRSEREKARTALLIEATKYLDKLSPVLYAYIISQIGSNNPTIPDNDLEMQEDVKLALIRIKKAEALKTEAEANEVNAQSKYNINELKKNK